MSFLLFTLYAPMASFGEIAVGERRMGWARPGRSAVLGLVAAAAGIDRSEDEAHLALETALHYAVRTDAPGLPLVDYHTAQTPRQRRGQSFATRKDELSVDNLNTVLSIREWRADAYFTVALWARQSCRVDLDGMANAMRHPQFTLYVGRKSAPLGLPLNPAITEADTFLSAFDSRVPTEPERDVLLRIGSSDSATRMIACDLDAPGIPPDCRRERRRDAVSSRARWQFDDRDEAVFSWNGGGV